MKKTLNKVVKAMIFVLCACIIFSFISSLCERKTYDGEWNYMAKLNEFYSMDKNSLDYICVGSSHMYCTINPLEVWNKSGVAGFVLATQQQPLRATYHYIKEALKTQSPKYVVLEGYMICKESSHDSAVLYDAVDPLKFSLNKIQMVNNLVEYDQRPEYYLNIIKYHTRWNQINADTVNVIFDKNIDTYKGYVAIEGKHSGSNLIPNYDKTKDIELSNYNTKVLNDIYDLVTKHGSEMILMFGPFDADSTELCEKVKAEIKWAEEKNIIVLDYCEMLNELKIDPKKDYYDSGHFDISGATKTSSHFALFLSEKGLGKNTRIDTEKWQSDYDAYVEKFSSELTD